jgi:small subunit ribosomal protein S16
VAVKIRLKRLGKIRAPYYRIVVADSRTKRDGRVLEEIGQYHPTEEPSFIEVKSDRAQYWLGVGAQPSPQVEAILKLTGDWGIFKGDKNAKSTVKVKEAKVVFEADEKKKPVLKPKAEKAPEPVAAPVEVPVAETAVEADAAADQVRADEADDSTTTTLETPAQADNSDAPAAAAPVAEAETAAVAEPAEAPAEA